MVHLSCIPVLAPVAQRIRASVFGTEGRGFESLRERLDWEAPHWPDTQASAASFYPLLLDAVGIVLPAEIESEG